MAIDTKRVFKHFEGIDVHREKVLRDVKLVKNASDMYSESYIDKFMKEKTDELKADRLSRVSKAKEEIEQIKKEMTTKKYKNPYEDIKAHVITPEHKLLVEMQLARKLEVLKAELAAAKVPAELKELHEQYGEYEHFSKLIQSEIKQRIKGEDGGKYKAVLMQLNQPPVEIRELAKLEHTLTFISNLDKHPVGLEKAAFDGEVRDIKFEPLI